MLVAMNIAQLITNDLGLSYYSIDIRMRMAIDPSIDATISNEVAQLCCKCTIQRRILMLWRHNGQSWKMMSNHNNMFSFTLFNSLLYKLQTFLMFRIKTGDAECKRAKVEIPPILR